MAELKSRVATELQTRLDAFVRDNSDLLHALDLLSMEIDEYERVLARANPPVISSNSSVDRMWTELD